jgi:uncharacterized protein YqgC (DUF456 family)
VTPADAELLQLIAYIGLALGLLGTVAPVIPGPVLIWLSALLWAWADGFERIGWPTLLLLALMTLLAEGSDLLLAGWGARKGGVARRSILTAVVGAILGFVVLNFPGALVGALGGLLWAEAQRQDGDWGRAWQSSKWVVVGYVAAMFVQVLLALGMLFVFATQAFGWP